MSKRKRFGEILVDAKVVTEPVLQLALEKQKGTGKRLGQVLEEMGVVSEKDTAVALARQFGFRTVQNLASYSFPEDVLTLFSSETALKKSLFPLKLEQKNLYLAMVNPLDMDTIDDITFRTGLRVLPCVTTPGEIQAAVHQHYLGGRPNEPQQDASDWWTILVVDDQELVRSAIIAALKKEGYKILEADNGADGLKVACQHHPHLIISDTVMPRMDGYEMFRALQAHTTASKIPVIALSSKSAAEEEAKLLDAGYFDFIPKPINPIRLLARVRRALKTAYNSNGPPPR
ncbi:response regulator [Trichloromonas sp.]|uniref:response regulator n=1 Tax=Trichloromonas sp. TaxID=3069249 RepID=UPI003D81528C